jgi:hypothetical protein
MFNLLADVDRTNVSNLVSQLATLNEFWLIMRLLDAVDYGAPATAATTSRPEVHTKIRNLARLGEAVLNVDTHDFESWCQDEQIPQHIRDDLALRTWPLKMQDEATGALHSLIPTFELLLEVFETRILKGDISMGLSCHYWDGKKNWAMRVIQNNLLNISCNQIQCGKQMRAR